MKNADLFKDTFGTYATEIWSMPENDFLKWLNEDAEPKTGWIPVSERLPDLWDERYLVSLAWGGVGVMEYKSTGFHNYGSFSPVPIETVTAWMPLPEPYKEESEENK